LLIGKEAVMYKGASIAVVVPAYNEAELIGRVLETMPDYVDNIIVVDDASDDHTSEVILSYESSLSSRLILIRHEVNQGVGGAIITGHRRALAEGMDVVAVMAGDAQMDPSELNRVLAPVIEGRADYAKGNRFFSGEAWETMPRVRYFANAALSMLTKIASGHWHIADPQCGYTAISRQALGSLDLDRLSKGYQFENSMLVYLNVLNLRVVDVPVRPIYGIGEDSGIQHGWAMLAFTLYLALSFVWRLKEKYIIRDFHPLVFFYLFGLLFCPPGLLFGLYLLAYRLMVGPVQATSALFAMFLFTSGLQFLLFAMWFDKDYTVQPGRWG
jgi:glycosyltransferase involved in cell wall biosynthesis